MRRKIRRDARGNQLHPLLQLQRFQLYGQALAECGDGEIWMHPAQLLGDAAGVGK